MREWLPKVHGQDSSREPQFFTYGNSRNSFTAGNDFANRIDYIFFRSGPNIQVGETEELFICDMLGERYPKSRL